MKALILSLVLSITGYLLYPELVEKFIARGSGLEQYLNLVSDVVQQQRIDLMSLTDEEFREKIKQYVERLPQSEKQKWIETEENMKSAVASVGTKSLLVLGALISTLSLCYGLAGPIHYAWITPLGSVIAFSRKDEILVSLIVVIVSVIISFPFWYAGRILCNFFKGVIKR